MSNTLTTISATLIQDQVLPALKLGLLPLNAMSRNYVADRPLSVGDTVKVNVVSAKSAGTFSSTFESGDSTVTGTSVTIVAPAFSSWYVNPKLEGIPTAERFIAEGKEAAYAVAKTVLQAALAKFVTANIGNGGGDLTIVTAGNYDVDDIADFTGMLLTKGVAGNFSAIHNIAYSTAIKKDAALQDASAYGSNELIRTGQLPSVLGCQMYFTDAFPTAVTNENVGVIFTGPETVAVAIGGGEVPVTGLEAAAGVREIPITDPETGLTMMWRTWVNTATGAYWGSVYCMYGVAFLRNSAVRCTSA